MATKPTTDEQLLERVEAYHRNGYINRQAVESFVHHPYDGQVSRFTEWF